MIAITATVQYRGAPSELAAAFEPIRRRAFAAAAVYWQRTYLPLHFKTIAYLRYKGAFKPRSKGYRRRKQQEPGRAALPLVWSGALRDAVLSAARISSTGRRTDLRMRGTRALNLVGRPGMPDMKSEITAINQSEAGKLAKDIDADMERALNAIGG